MGIALKLNTPIIGWSPSSLILIYTHTLFDMYTPLNKSRCGKPTLCRSFSKRRTMGFPHTPGYISARGNWRNNRMELLVIWRIGETCGEMYPSWKHLDKLLRMATTLENLRRMN